MGLPGQVSSVQLRLHVSWCPYGVCGVVTQSLTDNCSSALTRSEHALLMVIRLKTRYGFGACVPPSTELSEKQAME